MSRSEVDFSLSCIDPSHHLPLCWQRPGDHERNNPWHLQAIIQCQHWVPRDNEEMGQCIVRKGVQIGIRRFNNLTDISPTGDIFKVWLEKARGHVPEGQQTKAMIGQFSFTWDHGRDNLQPAEQTWTQTGCISKSRLKSCRDQMA